MLTVILNTTLTLTLILCGTTLGAALSSYIVCMAERKALGEKHSTRSHCKCGRTLTLTELTPIFGGWNKTTPCCKTQVPTKYSKGELATAIPALIITTHLTSYLHFPNQPQLPLTITTLVFGTALAIILAKQGKAAYKENIS